VRKLLLGIAALALASRATAITAPVTTTTVAITPGTTPCFNSTAPSGQFTMDSAGRLYKCVANLWEAWDVPACPESPPSSSCRSQSFCKDGASGFMYACWSSQWKVFGVIPQMNTTTQAGVSHTLLNSIMTLDHTNDRSAGLQRGIVLSQDFSSTSTTAKAGNMRGLQISETISGTAITRDVETVQGILVQLNAVATPASGGTSPTACDAITTFIDLGGTNQTFARTSHLFLSAATPPGTGSSSTAHYGIKIEDQSFTSRVSSGDVISIDSQTSTTGGKGNISMLGGTYNTGHYVAGTTHLWQEVAGRLRVKSGAPTSATDGNAAVTGTGATTHGVVLWGTSTATSTNFDTGTEVCVASGLTCQTTFNPSLPGTAVICGTQHTDASGYFTALCY